MTEVQSTKTEPFCDFTKQAYSIFTDDFCHEKLFVFKPSVKTAQSTIKIKETVTHKGGNYQLADELKLWLNLPRNGTLYTKWKNNDYVKLHYDDGVRLINGKKFYFYAALNTNKSLNLNAVKLGVGHDSQHCHSDNRLKISQNKGIYNFKWYNRTMVYHDKLTFGLVTCLDLCSRVLQKNNLLFGYSVDNSTKVFLRAENDGFREHNPSVHHP